MTILEQISANPFMVLGATPKDSRAKLIARQAELALFDDTHQTDEALCDRKSETGSFDFTVPLGINLRE